MNNYISKSKTIGLLVLVSTLISVCVVGRARDVSDPAATPTDINALFAEALHPEPTRLQSARDAAAKGKYTRAIEDYQYSIEDETGTAEAAIRELVGIYISQATTARNAGRFINEADQLIRCHTTLQRLFQQDNADRRMSDSARDQLDKAIEEVRSASNDATKRHIDAADQLRKEAKSFFGDDEAKQAQALHEINLAWQYYSADTDESMVDKMHDIHSDLKGELSSWQYNQVMERDRLKMGRLVDDRLSVQ